MPRSSRHIARIGHVDRAARRGTAGRGLAGLDSNLDDIGLGNVKAGGSLLWLGYRRYF